MRIRFNNYHDVRDDRDSPLEVDNRSRGDIHLYCYLNEHIVVTPSGGGSAKMTCISSRRVRYSAYMRERTRRKLWNCGKRWACDADRDNAWSIEQLRRTRWNSLRVSLGAHSVQRRMADAARLLVAEKLIPKPQVKNNVILSSANLYKESYSAKIREVCNGKIAANEAAALAFAQSEMEEDDGSLKREEDAGMRVKEYAWRDCPFLSSQSSTAGQRSMDAFVVARGQSQQSMSKL